MDKQQYWKERAGRYSSFKWAKDPAYLTAFVLSGNFQKDDYVLDVGIGTGLVAKAVSPLVKTVVGIDNSLDMLAQCHDNGNVYLMHHNIKNSKLRSSTFDKVTARNVFHHITDGIQKAMNECYRLLQEGGKIIIGERIPPADKLKKEYADIFKLKDERLIFIEEDLVGMMAKAGFRRIAVQSHWTKDISVRDWLKNTNLPKGRQDKIFSLHIHGSDVLRQAYNMRIDDGDCLIDIKNLILIGKK